MKYILDASEDHFVDVTKMIEIAKQKYRDAMEWHGKSKFFDKHSCFS